MTVPPETLDAERTLLGVILVNPAVLDTVADVVSERHFAEKLHARAYAAMQSMRDDATEINLASLRHRLASEGSESAGLGATLAAMVDGLPRVTDGSHWAALVRDGAKRRALVAACAKLIEQANEGGDTGDLLAAHHALVERLLDSGDGKHVSHIREALKLAMADLDTFSTSPDGITGIPTGLHGVDELLGGLQRGALTVIAARPRRGKSVFCTQTARFAAGRGLKVLAFTLEMPPRQVAQRVMLSEARVERYMLRTSAGDAARSRISSALPSLTELPIWLDDREAPTIAQIAATCRRMKAAYGLDLVIVDYIQRCGLERKVDRWVAIGDVVRGLKGLSLSLNVAVLAAAQLNRQGEDARPHLGMLRESGDIEAEADVIGFLHPADGIKPEEFLRMQEQPMDLIVEKNRNGSGDMVPLTLERRFTRFTPRIDFEVMGVIS
jgi:replicative DNA helicase